MKPSSRYQPAVRRASAPTAADRAPAATRLKAVRAFTSPSEERRESVCFHGVRATAKQTRPGFTLVELLVVISIFGLISLSILANNSRFNSSMLLGSLAYDIALSVREAQVYGLSVKGYSSNFQVGYGIRFDNASTYTFFTDTNANKQYDSGTDAIIDTYSVGAGHAIERFCAVNSLGQSSCSDDANPIHHLDVVFFRPDPDANISTDLGNQYSSAKIVVDSPSGETRTITIQSTGQIAVTNP